MRTARPRSLPGKDGGSASLDPPYMSFLLFSLHMIKLVLGGVLPDLRFGRQPERAVPYVGQVSPSEAPPFLTRRRE